MTYNQDNEVTKGITIAITANGAVTHTNTGSGLTALVTGNTAEVGDDVLSNIESYTGTEFADIITVTGINTPTGFGLIEIEGAGGNDTITGLLANGTFTRASYITATDSVTVTFNNSGTGIANTGTAVGNSSVGTDTLTNIRDVRGGNYDDVINGRTSGVTAGGIDNNVFQGGAGGKTRSKAASATTSSGAATPTTRTAPSAWTASPLPASTILTGLATSTQAPA